MAVFSVGCVVSSVSCKVCRVSVCPVSCVVWAWGETRNDLCAFILLLYFTFESGCITRIKIGPGNSIHRCGDSTHIVTTPHTRSKVSPPRTWQAVLRLKLYKLARGSHFSPRTRDSTLHSHGTRHAHTQDVPRVLYSAPVSPHMPLHSHATRVWLQAPLP